jgi:hypothetical protein
MKRLRRRRAERILLGPEHVDGGARVCLRRIRIACCAERLGQCQPSLGVTAGATSEV